MRKVIFFMFTTLDGFFEGREQGDLSWHHVDEEFVRFSLEQIRAVDMLLFGRVTYEMMASYWATPAALDEDPLTTERMNNLPKIVFSKTLSKVDWQNTRLVKADFAEEISRLKQAPGKDLIIFGSSDLAVTFIEKGLIDEFRIMINPVALGGGKSLFHGLQSRLELKLIEVRPFKSGNVLLSYIPARE
jgi:dihydrofolate reductase